MKVLQNVKATPEQLTVLSYDPSKPLIIRGAAGSGKTTTALLRLRVVVDFWQKQFARNNQQLNVLVLTFNRTLAGYVEALAQAQVRSHSHVSVQVTTFGNWATEKLGRPNVLDPERRARAIKNLAATLGLDERFLVEEVDYATGRFLPHSMAEYLTVKREGRGLSPQMPLKTRERLVDEVIIPLSHWKQQNHLQDWGDLAVVLAEQKIGEPYHIVVVDETQDFQANQVRAILNQLADEHSLTFVLDGAQRIYPHFFRWNEVGLATAGTVRTLSRNYRNTKQIAAFAKALIDGVEIGPDGAMPDFTASVSNGPLPTVLIGRFGLQMKWAINYIRSINLAADSVAFLHPLGWFKQVRLDLEAAGLPYEELSREREWPTSPSNIALSTMHSAKGLEFDHVMILGLNGEVTRHGTEDGDTALEDLRRLVAMAVGRARKSVVIGYKREDTPELVKFFKQGTFTPVTL